MNRFRDRRPDGPPVVIAHRGDSSHAPENTMEAARLGHASGAFAWEFDVHRSRDGVVVVIHDETLSRTTDVARRFAGDPRAREHFRVADFDWAEIRELDAGSWFLDPSAGHRTAAAFGTLDTLPESDRVAFGSGNVRIPSLVEALSWTKDVDWLANIELKTFPEADPPLLDAVLDAIDRTGTADRVLISSFNHHDVARLTGSRPDLAAGALSESPLHRPSTYVRDILGADFYHPSIRALGASSRIYGRKPTPDGLLGPGPEALNAVPHLVYTVNDPRPDGLAAHLASVGIAGVFTDDPAALKMLWDGIPRPSRPGLS